MQQTVFGTFSNQSDAENAVEALKTQGYDVGNMSVMMKNKEDRKDFTESTGVGENVAKGATSGAVTGAGVGALAGLLIGIGAIAIPGIGGLLIGGPIAAALGLSGAAATTASGAMTGALAGGLVGALVGLGVPEEDAKVYEKRVNEGAVLLAVPTRGNDDNEAKKILEDNRADQVKVMNLQS